MDYFKELRSDENDSYLIKPICSIKNFHPILDKLDILHLIVHLPS